MIIIDKSLAVANVIDDTFWVGVAIKYGVDKRNFPVDSDFGEFFFELDKVNFFIGSQPFQKSWRNGLMIFVGELAHFIYRGAQVIGMNLERQPERFESVKNACQFFNAVPFNIA